MLNCKGKVVYSVKKTSKYLLCLIMFILITIIVFGCGFNSYQTTKYLNMVYNNDSQQRLITIGKFKGTMTDTIKFKKASELKVELKIEQGDIDIALYDVDDQQIFEKSLSEGETYEDTFQESFQEGTYKLKLSSKKALGVEIKLIFRD